MQLWALIIDGFRESRDRRIFWVMLLLSCVVAAAMACIRFEAGRVDVLFGMWSIETDHFTAQGALNHELIAALIVDGIMDTVLGSIGIVLSIIATAGFLPHLLERGSIEIVVSKPLARWKLFLGRYVGGISFVFFHACIFVGLTFLVAGWLWGVWLPGYLIAVPLITLLFSFLYCISALAAVLTRGTIAAVLITLAAWTSFAGIQTADDLINAETTRAQRGPAQQALHLTRQVVPKTQDMLYIAKRWSRAANSIDLFAEETSAEDVAMMDQARKAEEARRNVPAWHTIGSSLLFEFIILGLAIWRFAKMDF